ncbi:1-deoxy-D-xylulose-5-phosphate reductoisomerase [Egicoccus halophilus]|uniref:1-deoxy-D-xylulose 5-phosphate reductoisomerase n=1 Tax=Egicoccus halophilus TaxID=1670830 RepID=A0A8J3EUS1_9ACTN|nr:1-deoxy-D-xylulose-5-phosphate reductoisomerase [Egicoccus halophilus]GGI06514.1 1-deoxy-D-xylulose 5-phosphate reductoisomerase [Egicoccus halophilus]
MTRRRVVLLGATGSIGTQALEVVRAHPERFEVVGLAAGRDAAAVSAQARDLGVRTVALADVEAARTLRAERPDLEVLDGTAGVAELARLDADLVLNGITGAVGLEPTLAALHAGTPVGLANKESLIVGGELVVAAAEAAGGRESHLVPVDSEHSALAQCLRGGRRDEVGRLVLTASGGPFRGRTADELREVTVDDALAHPTWAMGPVITCNSATLMNKGHELIEAHELFGIPWDRLDVVVHPQSVVHSMVEFVDGSTLAQLSPPDMRLPIQLALAWPERLPHAFTACDWTQPSQLTFEPVDRETFRALDLAEFAGRRRGTWPAVLNAANEVAVDHFFAGRLGFLAIPELVERTLEAWGATSPGHPRDLDDVLAADAWARRFAGQPRNVSPSVDGGST